MGQKAFKIAIICLLASLLLACGATHKEVIRGARVPELKLPDKIDILEPDTRKEPGTTYIDQPKLVKPGENIKGGKEGNVCLQPKDWRTLKYGIVEYYRWMLTMKKNVEDHNRIFDEKKQSESGIREFLKDWTWKF
jgi:hypothetical protein